MKKYKKMSYSIVAAHSDNEVLAQQLMYKK